MSAPEQPKNILNINDSEVEITAKNASLYTFAGACAMYDHAYVIYWHNPQKSHVASFVFKAFHPDVYDNLRSVILEEGFPAHLNVNEVPPGDLEAFARLEQQETEDLAAAVTVPAEWSEQGSA